MTRIRDLGDEKIQVGRDLKMGRFYFIKFNQRVNRPFYRYGGHIELIRFKEYYRMPRENEHIWFVFSSAFRDIFS